MGESTRYIFLKCQRLRKLTLNLNSNFTGFSLYKVKFPRLKSITLILNSDIEMPNLIDFFSLNSQLKELKLIHRGGRLYSDYIISQIANHLRMLKSLTIDVDDFQAFVTNMDLLNLKKLRKLQLNCNMFSIAPLIASLAANETIEILCLKDGILTENLIDAISKCKKLKSLEFCSMSNFDNRFLSELAQNLPEITDLHIIKCQVVDVNNIVQFVSLAQNLKTLHIINTGIKIDNTFFESLISIYKNRVTQLSLSLGKIPVKIDLELLEKQRFVEVKQTVELLDYDAFVDEFPDINSEGDNNGL